MAIELKAQNGKLRVEQAEVLSRLEANGAEVHVCRTLEAVRAVLDAGGAQ